MKKNRKISILCFCCFVVLLLDVASLYLVDDAFAILGTRRRTARRTAVVVHSADASANAAAQQQAAAAQQQATASQQQAAQAQAEADAAKAETAAAQQQAAAAEQQAAQAQAEAEAAKQQAAAAQAPHAAPGPLPIGTITTTLPAGCTTKVVDNVQYYNDGTNYYRAVFQGSQLVYVTAQP
jgi:flagellar biosynthesis GTPase FlhF